MKKIVLLSLIALALCVFPTNMRAENVCHAIGEATTTGVVTNLTASDVSYTSATISWDVCASCTNGYDVVCSTSPVTDFSTATIQHVTTNSINLTDLEEYTDYYVYVRARCGIFSEWSQALHFKTLLDCTAPGNVTITDVRKYSMTLNWTTKASISSYDIILSTTALTDPSSATITCNVAGTSSSKEFTNLQRETTYYLYIRANCDDLYYSEWMEVSATTLPLGYDCGRTADYVCGTGSYTSYELVHSSRLCNYTQMIYTADELHGLGFTAGPIKAVEFNFESDAAQYQKEQSVYIGTTSKDKFTEENVSEFVPGLTLVYGPERRDFPTAGGWLRYDFNAPFYWDGVSNIVIGFLSNKCNGDTKTGGWQAYYTKCDSTVIFSCDDNFLNVNNIQNSYLKSARPNIKFATCLDNNPCPPLTSAPVASNITHDAATITWNAGSEGNASSYDMIVSENSISDFTNVTPTYSGITATSSNLDQLTPETHYYVYVRVNCVNGGVSEGSSEWSPVCEFQTDEYCKTPYNLSVTNIDEHNATLNWNVTDNTATSFDLVVSNEPLADPSTGTIQDITATNNGGVCSSSLDHLVYNTYYYLYIRTDCGDGTSRWSSVEFNTMSILDCNSTQPVVVADGTANDYRFPVCGLMCDRNQKTQSIYPASKLADLLGNKIKKLKYFVESGGSSYNGNWENATFNIRMKTTNESTLSSGSVSTADATLVYSGTLRASVQNGMEITLAEPFDYTGGNLLIEFELPTSTGWSRCEFYGTKAGGNVSCYQSGDEDPELSDFLPKVEFTTCEKTPACPALSAAPIASDVTYNSATITWNAGAGEYVSTYDIIVSENEMTEGETQHDASLQTDDTFYNLTGLNPETHYYVYVRVNCNADGYADGSSLWSPACEFTTEPFCAAPENFAVADKTSASARLSWTKRGAAESWRIHVAPDNRTVDVNSDNEDCQIDGNQVSYTLTGLMPNTNDTLRLQSIYGDECSADLYADEQPSFRTLNNVIGITSFSLNDDVVVGDVTIDASNHTISVTTRYGTGLSNLAFTLTLADVNGIAKYNEENLPQSLNFTDPVAIQVYAEDRSISQEWTISIVNETCASPYNLSVTNIAERTATLSWNVKDNTATSFDIVVSKESLDPSTIASWQNITTTNNAGVCMYNISGPLTPVTHYYVYIRTDCGNKSSRWSSVEFNTMSFLDCDNNDTIVVADGQVIDGRFPVYGLECNHSQKTQSIYPASMLAGLMGNKITKLKYFVQNGGSSNWGNATFNIRMMATTQSTLSDSVSTANATPVYSGTLRANTADGMEITLTTPFEYTGGNLLIEFELPVAAGWTRCSFYGIEADGNVSGFQMYDDLDLSTFLPKVEFTTCEKVVVCPALSAAPVASGVTSNAATITWNAGTGDHVSTYDIIVSNEEINDFTNITTHNTSETSYNLTSLSPETGYYVYVRVNCNADGYDDGSSLWSPACEFTTEPFCQAPAGFSAQVLSSTTARLTWTKRGAAENWRIHVAPDNRTVDVNSDNEDCQIDGNQVSYTLTGLMPNTNDTLRLQSIYGDECSADLYADEQPSFRTLNNVIGITSFSLNDDVVVGDVTIDASNHTISVTTLYGTDLSNLAFKLTLADVNGIAKYNEENLPQSLNFTDPVAIQVYAEDRNITPQEWTISIVNETCATPYNLRVTNIAERTATLNWNVKDNTATSFDIVVSKEQLDPSTIASWQDITTTNNAGVWMYNISGPLTPDAHYYVYIRTDFGNETSHWSSVEFNTMPVFDCNSTDAVVVAEGTVKNEKFPVYGHYCDHSQKTQSIYPASMLMGLLGNKITKLKYFVQDGGSEGWENATFNIRMKTTNESTLSSDSVSTANATLVYSGTLRANVQNGMEITLTDSFDYSGGNLLIEFELPVATGWSRCFFYGIEADGNVSRFQMWNGNSPCPPELSTFLPKVEFTTCEKVVVCPEVTDVAATNVDESSATISWTESEGKYANTSDIYYSTTRVTDFTGIVPQFTDISGNPQQITGLAQNTTYYVYVRTHCDAQGYDDGISGWVETSFRTLAQCRVPGDLKATVTGKQTATVAWTNTSGTAQQADNFTYILSTTSIAEDALDATTATATGVNATSVDLTNLQSETTYYFYLKNVCTGAVNCSSPWVSCQFTTPIAMPAVINLQAHDIAHNAFTATWERDTANFADETEWEVACVPAGGTPNTWTQVSVPEYFALGLTAETKYDFYVRAKSGDSHSANAKIEVATIQKNTDGCKDVVIETYSVSEVPVYSNSKGSYTVQIYTVEQLREFGCTDAGNIEKIAFYQNSCSNTSDASKYRKKTTVWIGNTDKESFSGSNDWIPGLTQVMSETPIDFNKNGDWVELEFDQPFLWDGESNLAVAVLAYSAGYTFMYFAGGSVAGERSICVYAEESSWSVNDGVPSHTNSVHTTSQLANIKLCFEEPTCTPVDKLKVDNITNTSARAHWYPGDAETTWHVYNSTTEMTAAELAALTQAEYTVVSTNPEISLDDLIKDTDYYLYVRAACGDDDVSHWRYYKYSTLPTCSAPVSPTATTVNNSVTFAVNRGEYGVEGTYEYHYWISGSESTANTVTGGTSVTVNNLSGDKDYEWEVRANCSGSNEGSSRWVKGNTVHVCGAVTLPYFNDFEQYEDYSVPDCWTIVDTVFISGMTTVPFPCMLSLPDQSSYILFVANSSIATPLIDVPNEGIRISFDLLRMSASSSPMNVMFATNLADTSTYSLIDTFDLDENSLAQNMVTLFNPQGVSTQGYIIFKLRDGDAASMLFLDNLLIEAMPTSDTKDVTVDNVTYTISGLLEGNGVTIEKVSFKEVDLTEADFDITYNNTFLNYKHKLDVPTTLTDVIKDRYKVVAIKADAFNDVDLTKNVRVNIPSGVTVINEGDMQNEEIVMRFNGYDSLLYGGNKYFSSKAYMVNIHGDGATLTQRPFGDNQPLQITYTNGDNITETEIIVNTHVYKTEGEMQFKYEEGEWSRQSSESGTFEAMLNEDEATIDVGLSNTIRVDTNARYNGTFDLTFCNELKFQTDNVNRRYPDCQFTANMPLGDSTKVKAEMKFNNKEYYYFSLPFDCELSGNEVLAGTAVVTRSATIDDAVNSTDLAAHHYVLFRWNESAYTDSLTTGYVAFSGTKLEKNKGYVIAVVESYNWYSEHKSNYETSSLDVTATFAASNYTEIASSESEIEIPVTRASATNIYSGWNLVGNPFYGAVKSSQYSFNKYDTIPSVKYVRKVVFDRGGEDVSVGDYTSGIPVLNVDIKPFETVFIQKSDIDGDGTVTVTGSPVQKVQGAPAMLPEYVTITLNDSSRMIDRTTIINDELSSDDFLQEEDLLKSHQSSNEIYTQYGDYDFSFNEMNISDTDKTIPLAVKVAAEGDYTIAMSSGLSNYGTGQVFLHDKTLETYMKLSDGEVETLHLTEGVTEGRLEIVIKVDEVIVTPDDLENTGDDQLGIEVYMHHGIATIEGVEAGATVTIVDATGKTLYTTTAQSDRMDYQFIVRGVYMITVRNNNSVNTVKVVY